VRRGRVTLGLYNSYDPVKFHEAHRRALARAGPLALAYDFNLVTFGFPYDKELRTPVEIARWTADSTSIGKGGKYLVELAEKGRFSAFPFPDKGFPPQLGTVVVTTCNPGEGKLADPAWAASEALRGRSLCLVFGLGPRGLDKKVLKIGQKHLEVTGKSYSLETCTAIGAVAGAVAELLKIG